MNRYLEIFFRSKWRLVFIVILLPLALSGLDLYLWRSYSVSEVIWVDDPSAFGPAAAPSLGYNPYLTPSQNEVLLFSNMIGTEKFNDAMVSKLTDQGVIKTPRDRATVLASLSTLSIAPGGVVSSAAATASGYSPNRIMTLQYTCSDQELCKTVLADALDVYRAEYSDQKARAVATARAIYQSQLASAQTRVSTTVAALQAYNKDHPSAQGAAADADPIRNSLNHDVDQAEANVDEARKNLEQVETAAQISNGVTGDMAVLDPPTTARGLFGIPGMQSSNLKTDAIVLAVCLVAAIAYVLLVAFLDRTVREPDEVITRTGKSVVTIRDYAQRRWPWNLRRKAA